jgi:hypothetical protein
MMAYTEKSMTPTTIETEKRGADSLDRLVRRLYETRQAASAAKKARAELAAKIGRCEAAEDNQTYCFHSGLTPENWCDVCKAKQPMWDDYQKKSALAGAALRDVLRVAKTLTPNDELCNVASKTNQQPQDQKP